MNNYGNISGKLYWNDIFYELGVGGVEYLRDLNLTFTLSKKKGNKKRPYQVLKFSE